MKQKEQPRIIELDHHFEKLFRASQDGILILNFETGKIEDANPFIVKLLGYSRTELIGKELWEIGAITDKEAAQSAYKVLKGHGHVRYNDLPLQTKSGMLINVEFLSNAYDLDHHFIIQCLIRDISERADDNRLLAEYKNAASVGFEEMANAFSSLIEQRDSYTSGHQKNVAALSVAIAKEMNLHPHTSDGLKFSARIHDIGKMAIPAEILTKPDTLNPFEIAMLRNHAQAGYDVVKNIKFPWPVAQTILQHHERLNGTGYPNNLKGGDIILEARILAVADTIEAMTGRRPYRLTPGLAAALETIQAGRATLFDPEVVAACLKVFESGFSFNGLIGANAKSHETQHL